MRLKRTDSFPGPKKVGEEAATKERIATELDLARQIQMGALPVGVGDISSGKNFDIFACMNPAKEVGFSFHDDKQDDHKRQSPRRRETFRDT